MSPNACTCGANPDAGTRHTTRCARYATEQDARAITGPSLPERVSALKSRRSKSPSHIEELRSAVVRELEDWRDGFVIAPVNLLAAVERYDAAKGGRR